LAYNNKKHTYFFETYLEEKPEDNSMTSFFNLGYFYKYKDSLGLMGSIGYEIVDSKKEATVAYVGVQVVF